MEVGTLKNWIPDPTADQTRPMPMIIWGLVIATLFVLALFMDQPSQPTKIPLLYDGNLTIGIEPRVVSISSFSFSLKDNAIYSSIDLTHHIRVGSKVKIKAGSSRDTCTVINIVDVDQEGPWANPSAEENNDIAFRPQMKKILFKEDIARYRTLAEKYAVQIDLGSNGSNSNIPNQK